MSFNALIKHAGKHFKIYYYAIDSFEDDLPDFGKFLEEIEERDEKITAIVPNMGFVSASIFLGTSFQGIKGFVVITKPRF
jgi:short-subunit dehydrogenase